MTDRGAPAAAASVHLQGEVPGRRWQPRHRIRMPRFSANAGERCRAAG